MGWSSSSSVKSDSEMQDLTANPNPVPRQGALRSRAFKHLDRMDCAIRIFAVIAVVLLVATLALLGLAQAEYVHPLFALYAFSGSIAMFIVMKAIDCCQQAVAQRHKIDLQEDYYPVRQPILPKPIEEQDEKKKQKS